MLHFNYAQCKQSKILKTGLWNEQVTWQNAALANSVIQFKYQKLSLAWNESSSVV